MGLPSLGDFIAWTDAQISRYREEYKNTGFSADELAPLEKSHIFYLGDDDKIDESVKEITDDLHEEMRDGIPMPFNDLSSVSLVGHNCVAGVCPFPCPRKGTSKTWTLDRVILNPKSLEGYDPRNKNEIIPSTIAPPPSSFDIWNSPILQRFVILRAQYGSATLDAWPVYYLGMDGNYLVYMAGESRIAQKAARMGASPEAVSQHQQMVDNESNPILRQIAAISHPANYVVRVTPRLTPKEERRAAAGKNTSLAKLPHFIVVDHDVLVDMRTGKPIGTHASPVPHHRRGHWMRLAERCQKAKLLGKEKIWIKPMFVGDRNFEDQKNLYEVLLDFSPKAPSKL